jgi:hypothetical protein
MYIKAHSDMRECNICREKEKECIRVLDISDHGWYHNTYDDGESYDENN